MKYQILQGDNRQTLKTLADNSIDAIVTDPPYGIDFLGKAWDANTGALETYQECLRVLKPGGHILAFSAARTYHHLAVTLEQAGFEIRDQIMWIYSSGFPKSQDIGKSIQRSMGVKEYEGFVDTTKNSGFGQMDVARQKVGQEWSTKETQVGKAKVTDPEAVEWLGWGTALKPAHEPIALARKPIKQSIAKNCQTWGTGALNIDAARVLDKFPSNVIGEILQDDYQKYFYCPKVSRKERHTGFELPPAMFGDMKGCYDENGERYAVGLDAREGDVGNNHPTVKPIELMKYLIKLITPPGGIVLDPFNGSGSTGCAAVELGHPYIGCELDPAYVEIAQRRIEAWYEAANPTTFNRLFEVE
jgi:site-specific DNA-methyltransferase (adenine-specific)